MQALLIALSEISESPTNPRRRFDAKQDAELDVSVREHGVLQPVLVRPLPPGEPGHFYELVFGHRRFRAAQRVGLEKIPTIVQQMSDLEVLEAQLVENRQRADVDPLDEAAGFRRLHVDHGKSIEEIAAKVGISRGTVYARLKLLELAPGARSLLADGKLDPSRALLLARLPESVQEKAAKEITKSRWDGAPMSYREAREHLERQFMLRLSEAPWKLDDAALVPKAGPCTTCPKRSGNQKELFDSGEAKDLCTDGACFRSKRDAHSDGVLAAAEAKGARVIRGGAARKIVDDYGTLLDRSFERLDATCHQDPKYRTYRQLLKKADVERVVVANARKGVIELVPRAGLTKALKAAGHDFSKEFGANQRADDSYKRKQEIRERSEKLLVEAVLPKAKEIIEAGEPYWRAVLFAELRDGSTDTEAAATRRDISFKKHASAEALQEWVRVATLTELYGLALELMLSSDYNDDLKDPIAKLAGVDRTALEKRAKDAIAAEALAKRAGRKTAKCRECGCTDATPCEDGLEACSWVESDLCSACAPTAKPPAKKPKASRKAKAKKPVAGARNG